MLESIELHPKVTFLVGENGSGKSTLLEAMAVALGMNAEGGSGNFDFATRESHSELHEFLRIAKGLKPRDRYFLRAESLFNLGTEIERLDAEPSSGPPIIHSSGHRSLHEQSRGESFMALLTKRLGGNGLYLLDEPEAALSPTRQIECLQRLHELVLKNSQFIIATHSPILVAYPDAPGHSATPLARKLGIGARMRVAVVNEPAGYRDWLAPLPEAVRFDGEVTAETNVAHLFVDCRLELQELLDSTRRAIAPAAVAWVSWPRKTAKVPTGITGGTLRELALPPGFVDVKVCAVSDVWSGLKLVIRKALRGQPARSVSR